MTDKRGKSFIQATSCNRGAIGAFHVSGHEDDLSIFIDTKISIDKGVTFFPPLKEGELRYGVLFSDGASELDEVVAAKPRDGLRVVMCHGGRCMTRAVKQHFIRGGFTEVALGGLGDGGKDSGDAATAALAACLTQTQAAHALDWFAGRPEDRQRPDFPVDWLAVRHICLVGPPNAGKSSLLNRLSGFDRAFVHGDAGATRDVVGEYVELAGHAVLVSDFPGFPLPLTGMERFWDKAVAGLKDAACVVFVCDGSREWDETAEQAAEAVAAALTDDPGGKRRGRPPVLVVVNKADFPCRIAGHPWERHFPLAAMTSCCSLAGGDAEAKVAGMLAGIFADSFSDS